jgi:hypothetical protein
MNVNNEKMVSNKSPRAGIHATVDVNNGFAQYNTVLANAKDDGIENRRRKRNSKQASKPNNKTLVRWNIHVSVVFEK